MKFLEKYNSYILMVLLVMVLFRTCGIGSDVTRANKKVIELEAKVDSLYSVVVTEKTLKHNLQENMWESLELEELSDKSKVPINQLKNERFKK